MAPAAHPGVQNALSAANEFEKSQNTADFFTGQSAQADGVAARDAANAAHEQQAHTDDKSWMQTVKEAGSALANKVTPEAHAVEPHTGTHTEEAKREAKQGAANLADATKELGRAAADTGNEAAEKTKEGAAKADAETRGAFQSVKEFFTGPAVHPASAGDEARAREEAAKQEAAAAAHDTKEAAKARASQAAGKSEDVLRSAADEAAHLKDQAVGALKAVGSRFTAPISGDADKDRELAEKAKGAVHGAADTTRDAAHDVSTATSNAAIRTRAATRTTADDARAAACAQTDQVQRDANDAAFRARAATEPSVDIKVRNTAHTAEAKAEQAKDTAVAKAEQAKDTAYAKAEHAKNAVVDTVHETEDEIKRAARKAEEAVKAKAQAVEDYLTADVTPDNEIDALRAEGEIPSNTEDVTAVTRA